LDTETKSKLCIICFYFILTDTEAPKEIATRLRQKGNMIVSPIDLSLENSEKVSAEDLQWLNFYEPPLKLTLSNKGDNGKRFVATKNQQ
jgi:hypothetical protein